MDALECIFGRKSIRNFSQQAVEWEKVGIILDAAINAPSAGNLQNWKFIVVLEKEKIKSITECCLHQHWMATAPVHIIICSEPKKSEQHYGVRGERLYAVQNCAAAVENMLLAVHAQGLSSCWVGAFDEEKLKRVLNIPEEARPQVVLPIGYSNEKREKPKRQALYDKVFVESWGNRISNLQHVMGYYSADVKKVINNFKDTIDGKHNEKIHHKMKKGIDKTKDFFLKLKKKKTK